ncbi:MAG: response regulator transcription factor [Flavobacteriaceae bacterium]|jgi:DNA-binding response OmpR family regulator|uniref:Response regulator transcription factor n=1 Tax=Flavobacterium kayseriense TaxID=2764714 RepID=A0ABR7J4V3_9FLAO|nr:response regulator transcription factor [Flavobacterium kayseriense]MBC5840550.1 response regulator transcription factor [Flavobacterium kayseriense]MBC5846780.1 response regulator transcription factor [Flavobacterium kayseriense]MBU0942772.1 response regulator transcription factor [Bacteroidota bacterium]MBX9888526.1 response regulator transcription factor [Flavobacteriaceae bacterium]
MKLLIVEDEPNLLAILRKGLSESNHEVSVSLDGKTALEMISNYTFDVVVLDVMLPDINGIEICRRVRDAKNFVPILLLTALGTSENIVTGLNAGADDYLTKPFKFGELEARIQALHRRAIQQHEKVEALEIGDLVINSRAKTVEREGVSIVLTAKEFKLLLYLARNKEMIVSREQILDNVWDINFDMNTNVVDVYINYLRKKVDKPFAQKLIHTIKGLGYVIKL